MFSKFLIGGVLAATLLSGAAATAHAQPELAAAPSPTRGERLAQRNCAQCHAIGRTGDSPNRQAPTFRTLFRRYPSGALDEAFAAGLLERHPAMPRIKLSPSELSDLTAYLRSVNQAGQARSGAGSWDRS